MFCVCCFVWHNSVRITHHFVFVNNFFKFLFLLFTVCFFAVDFYLTTTFRRCQQHFYISVHILSPRMFWAKKRISMLLRFLFYQVIKWNGERGIWTLAPVTRPTPLAGAPLQPLEYFCSLNNTRYQRICAPLSQCIIDYTYQNIVCQRFFLYFF